jgi:hypothetical protein
VVEFLRAFRRVHVAPTMDRGALVALLICIGGGLMQYVDEAFDLEKLTVKLPLAVKATGYAAVAAAVTVFGGTTSQFIYFQF